MFRQFINELKHILEEKTHLEINIKPVFHGEIQGDIIYLLEIANNQTPQFIDWVLSRYPDLMQCAWSVRHLCCQRSLLEEIHTEQHKGLLFHSIDLLKVLFELDPAMELLIDLISTKISQISGKACTAEHLFGVGLMPMLNFEVDLTKEQNKEFIFYGFHKGTLSGESVVSVSSQPTITDSCTNTETSILFNHLQLARNTVTLSDSFQVQTPFFIEPSDNDKYILLKRHINIQGLMIMLSELPELFKKLKFTPNPMPVLFSDLAAFNILTELIGKTLQGPQEIIRQSDVRREGTAILGWGNTLLQTWDSSKVTDKEALQSFSDTVVESIDKVIPYKNQ